MNSALFNALGPIMGGNQGGMPGNNTSGFQNISQVLNQINQFRSTFQGNPQAKAMELLQSGKMSQSQFSQFAQLANQIRPLLGK